MDARAPLVAVPCARGRERRARAAAQGAEQGGSRSSARATSRPILAPGRPRRAASSSRSGSTSAESDLRAAGWPGPCSCSTPSTDSSRRTRATSRPSAPGRLGRCPLRARATRGHAEHPTAAASAWCRSRKGAPLYLGQHAGFYKLDDGVTAARTTTHVRRCNLSDLEREPIITPRSRALGRTVKAAEAGERVQASAVAP